MFYMLIFFVMAGGMLYCLGITLAGRVKAECLD
jgi:hypothetical protein